MTTPATFRVPLDTLRDAIGEAISDHVMAYNVPQVTQRLGLAPGTSQEAFSSKLRYVKGRILEWDETALLKLADTVVAEFGAPSLADLMSEIRQGQQRVSEITRRDVLKALNPLGLLFGDTDLFEGLRIVCKENLGEDGDEDPFGFETLTGRIRQHYIKNSDLSHEDLLIECGTLECTQARFFRLIERLLDPVVRRGEEQEQLAQALNPILEADGFRLVVVGEQSRHPRYGIVRLQMGVAGNPKNLIFAATNAKPDLYFIDAINNDIGIRNSSDALVFEEFLPDSGLRWSHLTQWWQVQTRLNDSGEAQKSLYRRLRESVRNTGSTGQYALFTVYYEEFQTLKEALPALIPEVYLHYDPRTRKERGTDPALLRQRMDFLLLLDHQVRIVIEVDGSQHYSQDGLAAPTKYAEMVVEDRRLRLAGYELYRFGAAKFSDTSTLASGKMYIGDRSRAAVVRFFEGLWRLHDIKYV